jgi:demethylmenaquinone methyltransferase/2-methoxy-6-polyprenyl-1,4-benzoquinol methylase
VDDAFVAQSTFARPSLTRITTRYDRLARWHRFGEAAIVLPPGLRRKAVRRLDLRGGETVLEVGCGTGRNLPLLCEAVGADGRVIGIDASRGMLKRAQHLVARRGLQNVRLMLGDATEVALEDRVDAVLFGLSYSVLPDRRGVLSRVWEALRPGGHLVVMDAGLPASRLGRLLAPLGEALARVFPGDPYSRPWEDLAQLGSVETELFQLGTYFICVLRRP